MIKAVCALLAVMALAAPSAGAKLFENPQTVSFMEAEATRQGSITLKSTGFGAAVSELEIWQIVPQGTQSQASVLREVKGPDSYRFDEDDFGNEILILEWENPPLDQRIDYSMSFDVSVRDVDDPYPGTSFPLTGLTRPTQAITERAYELTSGLTNREKFMELTSYVYGLVDYDDTYQNTQKSADWVFQNQRAVCDGHANLLISMLRSLGYNAYYVIGYAYTEVGLDPEDPNYWGPHGWVEVEHQGKAFSMDPTWLEAPVDATHVKFALAPDSNYTEYIQVMASNVEIDWDKGDYRIYLRDYAEEPKIEIGAEVVNPGPGSGEASVIVSTVRSADECVITELEFSSCTDRGIQFFRPFPEKRSLGFCGEKKLYWVIEAPDLEPGIEYLCGINLFGSGQVWNQTLRASQEPDHVSAYLSAPRVLTSGEFFSVNTTVENSGLSEQNLRLFLVLGDHVQETSFSSGAMQAADLVWRMRAPKEEGSHEMIYADSSGNLVRENIEVIRSRSIGLKDVSFPGNVSLGESLYLNLTVLGLEESMGKARVSIDGYESEREFFIGEGEQKTLVFVHEPDSEGVKHLNVVVITPDEQYQDGLIGNFLVTRELGFLDQIMAALRGFLESLFSALGMSS